MACVAADDLAWLGSKSWEMDDVVGTKLRLSYCWTLIVSMSEFKADATDRVISYCVADCIADRTDYVSILDDTISYILGFRLP